MILNIDYYNFIIRLFNKPTNKFNNKSISYLRILTIISLEEIEILEDKNHIIYVRYQNKIIV